MLCPFTGCSALTHTQCTTREDAQMLLLTTLYSVHTVSKIADSCLVYRYVSYNFEVFIWSTIEEKESTRITCIAFGF